MHFKNHLLLHLFAQMTAYPMQGQCFSTRVHTNYLGVSLKFRFCFSRSPWNLRFCISKMFTDNANAAGPQTILWVEGARRSESLGVDRHRKGNLECSIVTCQGHLSQPERCREIKLPGEGNPWAESEKLLVQLNIRKDRPGNSHNIFIHR